MWFNCPARIWNAINLLALHTGICSLDSRYTELMLAAAFVFIVLFLEMLIFTPFAYIDTFVVRKEHGFSKATLQNFLSTRFLPMKVVLMIYVPVIMLITRVVDW